jgi:lipoprotein-anchoring transpeptidase ErfK/SrfK
MLCRSAIALAFALSLAGVTHALALDANAIDNAAVGSKPAKKSSGADPLLIKAQILLDRARFSPGEIDGRAGGNFQKALAAFKVAQGLPDDSKLDANTWAKLASTSSDAAIKQYTITTEDEKGPFLKKRPAKMEDMKDLAWLGYTGPTEELAEKFHVSEDVLKALNPGKPFDQAGTVILVPNVGGKQTDEKVTKIDIDKTQRTLRAFGKSGQLLAFYPASVGSEEKPAPSGTFKVTDVERNPTYRYDPKFAFKGVSATKPFEIKPGPNNPVGLVWIGLSAPSYGIHGTPDASRVSKSYSHGCVRLTNWDAETLAGMVAKGAQVVFLDGGDAAPPRRVGGRSTKRSTRTRKACRGSAPLSRRRNYALRRLAIAKSDIARQGETPTPSRCS